MRWSLLVMAGCTRVLGVHDFAEPDAAIDAAPDAAAPLADAPPQLPDADTLGMGLLAHLTFDGNPIGADATGNGHGGTCNGMCTFTAGKLGMGIAFNGSSQVTLNGDFPTAAFTLAVWVAPTAVDNSLGCAFSRELGTQTGYALCFSKGMGEIVVGSHVSHFQPPSSSYHHYGLTWDGTKVTTYLDGVQIDTTNADLSTVNSKLFVGWEGRANDFTGNLDDLRYYGRVLSVDELLALTGGSQ